MKNERTKKMKKLTLIMVIVLAVTTCMSFTAMAEEPTTKESGVSWGDDNFAGRLSVVPVKSDLSNYSSYKEKTYEVAADGFMYFKLELTGTDKVEGANTALDIIEIKGYDGVSSSDVTDLQYKDASGTWVDGSALTGSGVEKTLNNNANHTLYFKAKFSKDGRYSVKGIVVYNNSGKEAVVRYYNISNGQFMVTQNDAYNLEDFKSTEPYTYPSQDGKIFVGWYSDKDCTNVTTATSGVAFAKFADAAILTAKAQTDNDAAPTAVRFLSSIDSDVYPRAGFIINGTYGTHTITNKDRSVTKCYKSVLADGQKVFPTVFSSESKYIYTYTITGLEPGVESTWNITPYLITPDNTKVLGTAGDFHFPMN